MICTKKEDVSSHLEPFATLALTDVGPDSGAVPVSAHRSTEAVTGAKEQLRETIKYNSNSNSKERTDCQQLASRCLNYSITTQL